MFVPRPTPRIMLFVCCVMQYRIHNFSNYTINSYLTSYVIHMLTKDSYISY